MATNRKHANARKLTLAVASGVESGDPVVVSQLPGVALTDRDDDGNAVVDFSGAYDLSVEADVDGISVGDILYFDSTNDPEVVEAESGNVRFGYALEAVASGQTATIAVKLGY